MGKFFLILFFLSFKNKTNEITTSSLFHIDGRPITDAGVASDSSPSFITNQNDIVFFLSTRHGQTNLFYKNIKTSQSVQTLTNYPIPIQNYRITPNYIVFSAQIYSSCGTNFDCTSQIDAALDENPNTGFVFDQLFVRHWDQIIIEGKYTHLFTQAIKMTSPGVYVTSGSPVDIMSSLEPSNSPVPPFGGKEQFSVSPSFDRISFTLALVDHRSSWSTGWMIYEAIVLPSNGALSSSPNCISSCGGNGPRTQNPTYDPSGRYIAYLSMERPGFEADRLHAVIYDSITKKHDHVSFDWDRSLSEIVWSSDGQYFLTSIDEDGRHPLYSFDIISKKPNLISPQGKSFNIFVTNSNKVFYLGASFVDAINVFSFQWDPSTVSPSPIQKLTNLNPSLSLNKFDPGLSIYFDSENGSNVQGWLLKPPEWNPSKKYPLVLLIHGGPQGAWTSSWSYGWNPQLWVQQGYVALMINPHGSTGFGQNFTDSVSGNWGGIPYRDLMKGLDLVLSNYDWIDKKRITACGGSYGGYMINWINGHTDRFSALVVHDGVFDIPSAYGSTDELWFFDWEFKGFPWTNPEAYQIWNPSNHVSSWKTPTLVIHGAKDYRLSLSQGLSPFTTLQRLGIPSRLLYFPLENHWVLKPSNNIMWYAEVIAWLNKYSS